MTGNEQVVCLPVRRGGEGVGGRETVICILVTKFD